MSVVENARGHAMRAALIALMLTVASPAAGAECGNLCDLEWWKTATEADVQAELGSGADVMARDRDGWTPLHRAMYHRHLKLTGFLLLNGAKLHGFPDHDGYTPLQMLSATLQGVLHAGVSSGRGGDLYTSLPVRSP